MKRIQAMLRRTGEDIPMDPMAVMGSVGSAAMLGATIVSIEKNSRVWQQVADPRWPQTGTAEVARVLV